MDRYIKHKIKKNVLLSCDENDLSIEGAKKLLITDGKTVADYEIGTSTFEEIKAWNIATSENLKTYSDKRKAEYPSIGDQLDMLWHAIDDGTLDKTSTFYTSLKATKDKYPKT